MFVQAFLSYCLFLTAVSSPAFTAHPTSDNYVQTIRQDDVTPEQVIDLFSDTTFRLRDGPITCPRQVQHGAFQPDSFDAVLASISFQDITVSSFDQTNNCNATPGFLSIGSDSQRIFPNTIQNVPATSPANFYGVDSSIRQCQVWEAQGRLAYIFSDNISTFISDLQQNGFFQNVNLNDSEMGTGRLWMLSFEVDQILQPCLLKEVAKYTPTSPEPSLDPSFEPPLDESSSPLTTALPASSSRPSPIFPNSTQTPVDERACFPALAKVTLESGLLKSMDALQIGDRVMVQPGLFSEVFMFTHRDPHQLYTFRQLALESGHAITVTSGHYIYINRRFAMASTARVGDILELGNGSQSTIVSVSHVFSKGLFNPQTVHGDIIVDNVRASTYTTAIQPQTAHALLSPLRAMFFGTARSTSILAHGLETVPGIGRDGLCAP